MATFQTFPLLLLIFMLTHSSPLKKVIFVVSVDDGVVFFSFVMASIFIFQVQLDIEKESKKMKKSHLVQIQFQFKFLQRCILGSCDIKTLNMNQHLCRCRGLLKLARM